VSAYALTRKAHTPTTRDNHRQNICSDLSHDALCEHFLSNLSNEGINLCACSGRFVHAPGRICEPGVGRRRRHHRSGAAPAAHRGGQGEGRRAALEAITRHALAHGLASAQADTRRHLFLLALQLRGDRLDLIHCRPFVARRRSRLELRPFCV